MSAMGVAAFRTTHPMAPATTLILIALSALLILIALSALSILIALSALSILASVGLRYCRLNYCGCLSAIPLLMKLPQGGCQPTTILALLKTPCLTL
jgi:hypothetical protein